MKMLINDKRRMVIIISHSIETLKELCDEVMWLHNGEIREIGKPDEVLKRYVKFIGEYNELSSV